MTLQERAQIFLKELGVPVLAFCRNAKISSTTFYDWQNGKELSDTTLERIESYLLRYGF